MARGDALYRKPERLPFPRTKVELDGDVIFLTLPDGRWRDLRLHGCTFSTGDARCGRRFVRHLLIEPPAERAPYPSHPPDRGSAAFEPPDYWSAAFDRPDRGSAAFDRPHLITPPDEGAIAPRVACLPVVPTDAAIIDSWAWEAITGWLRCGGRLAGCTVEQLAGLSCVATPRFAVALGRVAARMASEMDWEDCGPLRGSGGIRNPLLPFERAAARHPRARAALAAARATAGTSR